MWNVIVRKYKLKEEVCILMRFAYDSKFTPGVYHPRFKELTQKGLTAMCMVSENGEFMSFQDLKINYGLENKDLFRDLQIRDYFTKEIRLELQIM